MLPHHDLHKSNKQDEVQNMCSNIQLKLSQKLVDSVWIRENLK